MATPDYIAALRSKIGHDLLLLPGLTMVVLDDAERVLLIRRKDAPDRWSLVGGILEPGEQPGPAALREVREETGLVASIDKLAAVFADEQPHRYPNGDRVQFLTLVFRCTWVSGEAHVADDENLDVQWFSLNDRPGLSPHGERSLESALSTDLVPSLDV